MIFRLTVGIDPPPAAAANQAHRKWPHIRAKRELKSRAFVDAINAKRAFIGSRAGLIAPGTDNEPPLFLGPVAVRAVINWGKHRKGMDRDNARYALKGMWDGFTQAGIWTDDDQITDDGDFEQGRYEDRKDLPPPLNSPDGYVTVEIEGVLSPFYDQRDGLTLTACDRCGNGYRSRDLVAVQGDWQRDEWLCPECLMVDIRATR